ncbi:MAG: hypothetical protein AAF125_11580 [Chloroflexota bacterium]
MRRAPLINISLMAAIVLAACDTTPPELPTIAPTLPPIVRTISFGLPVQDTLSPSEPTAEWAFDGVVGQAISVQVEGDGVSLTLLTDDRTPLAQGEGLNLELPETGQYLVEVRLTAGEGAGYSLTVDEFGATPSPAPTATPTVQVVVALPTPTPAPFEALGAIQAADIRSPAGTFGAFNEAGEQHVYTFDSAGNEFVRLRMERASGNVDPVLTLYTPDGERLAVDDNGGGGRAALLNGIALSEDGTYAVVASGDGLTGTYQLSFESSSVAFPVTPVNAQGDALSAAATEPPIVLTPTLLAGVSGNRLEDHQPITNTLERPGEVQRYIIQADAGETFTVGVRPLDGNLRPQLQMSSPSGAIAADVATIGPDGEVLIDPYNAPSTGAYVIFVTGADDTTGRYALSYGRGSTRDAVRRGETFPDRSYEAAMTRRAVRHEWFLRLNAGDMVSAAAASIDGRFDPVLTLVGPDGSRVIQDDNSGGGLDAQIDAVRAPATGVYTMRVTSSDPSVFGVYSLIWRYIEAAPTATPPLLTASLFSIDDTITPDMPLFFPVQGTAGERLLIEVEAAPGSGLDTLVELLDPNGDPFAFDDDSGGNLNPSLLALIPEDGLYQVRVRVYDDGTNQGGAFVLRVRKAF